MENIIPFKLIPIFSFISFIYFHLYNFLYFLLRIIKNFKIKFIKIKISVFNNKNFVILTIRNNKIKEISQIKIKFHKLQINKIKIIYLILK